MKALDIRVHAVDTNSFEGSPKPGESPAEFVTRLSQEKAGAAFAGADRAVVVGADTVVVLDGEILGKPATEDEAVSMLRRLRDRSHTVYTGVTALDGQSGRSISTCKSTDVEMRAYSDDEVEAYVASGGPMDKAGAYAVQDASFRPAHRVNGCYLNVVGLPLCEVVGLLETLGVDVKVRQGWTVPERCDDCPLRELQEGKGS
jgi:MAF protein